MEILYVLGVTLFILILGVIISFIIFRFLGLEDGRTLMLKVSKDMNTAIETSVREKEYNIVFHGLLYLGAIKGVFSLFSNLLFCLHMFSNEDAKLKTLLITVIILNIVVIIGIMLVLYYDKLGVYLLTASAVLNFAILYFTQDLISANVGTLGHMLWLVLFYTLFFTLKKNGVTAYKLLFNNK